MRRTAREDVFKLIYESLFNKEFELSKEDVFNELNEQDKAFADSLLSLFLSNQNEIKEIISKNLFGYVMDRVFKVDLALLFLAVTEIKFYDETPKEVVINETLEIAKKYSTEKSSGFINAVLSSVIKDL